MTNKAKTRQQIASEYGVCTKTLKKRMDIEGITLQGGLITPHQQFLIYQKFGVPKDSQLFQNFPNYSDQIFCDNLN